MLPVGCQGRALRDGDVADAGFCAGALQGGDVTSAGLCAGAQPASAVCHSPLLGMQLGCAGS